METIMADPIVTEIVEDARAQPHCSSFDPVTCEIEEKEETVVAETVEDQREPMDPKLLRAIVNGDLILFKTILGIEEAQTNGDGHSGGHGGVTCGDNNSLLKYLFKRIMRKKQALIDQDVESTRVAKDGSNGCHGVTCGGNTALHVVAGAIEKPRRRGVTLSLTSFEFPSGARLTMVSVEIAVTRITSLIESLVKVILLVSPITRIYKHISAAPVDAYFRQDYAEPIHGISWVFVTMIIHRLGLIFYPHFIRIRSRLELILYSPFISIRSRLGLILYPLFIRIPSKRSMYLKIAEIICDMDPDLTLLSARNHAMETPLHCAAKAGNLEMVSLLLQFLTDRPQVQNKVLRTKNHIGETALHEAVRSGNSRVVKAFLDADEDLANSVDNNGISPMYLAVVSGCFDVVRKLIVCKHLKSYSGPDGQTALHALVLRQKVEENIIYALLERDPPLARAMDVDNARNTPLHYAAVSGNSYAVKELVLKDTKPVYEPNSSGSFPVHLAAEAGNFTVIKQLLSLCPDVGELLDKEQRNFLHVAVENKRTGVIMMACQEGINANVINAKDKNGNTPLHLAVIISDAEIFVILSQNKTVNPNIRNKAGLTPLDISTSLQDRQFTYSLNPQSIIHRALLTRGAFQNPCLPDISKKVDNLVKKGNGERAGCPHQREGKGTISAVGVDVEKESTKYENMSKSLITGAVLIASAAFVAMFTVSGVYRDDHTSHTLIRRRRIFKAFVIADMLAFICAIVSTSWLLYSALTNFHLKYRKFYFQWCTPVLYWAINLFILVFGLGGYIAIAPLSEWLGLLIVVVSGIAILWNIIWYPKVLPLLLLAPYLSTEVQ